MVIKTRACPEDMNTSALNTPELFFDIMRRRISESMNVSIPCRIVSYDRKKHRATLKVMMNWELIDSSVVNGCFIYDVNIRRMMAGGFLIDFPIAVGDTGWLIACDRDAYGVLKERTPKQAASADVNCYKSGFWIPDQFGDPEKAEDQTDRLSTSIEDIEIADEDEQSLVIQDASGKQKISLSDNGITLHAPEVVIDSKVTKINSDTIKLNGAVEIKGAAKSGQIRSTTTAQVQNGIIVGIN